LELVQQHENMLTQKRTELHPYSISTYIYRQWI